MLDEHGFGDHGTGAAGTDQSDDPSPADAEKARPDRTPHNPTKIETPKNVREFAIRHAQVLMLAGSVALARFVMPHLWHKAPLVGSLPSVRAAIFWGVLLAVVGSIAGLLPLMARQMRETAEELLARDKRKPILYLRSFEMESARAGAFGMVGKYKRLFRGGDDGTYLFAGGPADRVRERTALNVQRSIIDEQMVFAHAFKQFGPYIALGRPSEDFKDLDLGAAKKYVENHEWQQVVSQWLWSCAAAVIEAADSDNLEWELKHVVKILPPQRVLVICPHMALRMVRSCALPGCRPISSH